MQRSKIEVFIHYVWATKNRHPYLEDPTIERRVHRCIQAQAAKLGCIVLDINGMPDHVHIILKMPSTTTIAFMAQKMKGVSSTFARDKLFDGDAFDWQEGYAALSVSPNQVQKVRHYVQNQKQHHAQGTTQTAWEDYDEAA
jgi:REP element-mobilizing transposase RayT